MSSARCSGTCAPSARASATVFARPSASRSVRYSSAPWAASFSAVARPMPLAAPVRRQRLPSKPLACAMAVTLLTYALCGGRSPPRCAVTHSRSSDLDGAIGSVPRPTNALSCVSVIVVVAASVRTRAGRSSEIGRASASCSSEGDDLVDDAVVEVVHHLADLRVGVAGHRARRHHRVVVRVHRRGAADHPLGERGTASRPARAARSGGSGCRAARWRRRGSPPAPRTWSRSRSRSRTARRRPAR